MSPTLDAFLRSWPFDPWLLAALGLAAGVYLRGWLVLRRRSPQRWHAGRLSAFLGGLAVVYLALEEHPLAVRASFLRLGAAPGERLMLYVGRAPEQGLAALETARRQRASG